MSGIPAGETAHIRDDSGQVLLTYRSFASPVGIVASLVASIVILTGGAAMLFLAGEHHPLSAATAMILAIVFAFIITALVPPITVTLFNGTNPMLTIAQRSPFAFPAASFAVVTSDGEAIAGLRKSFFARFGRNRWGITDRVGRPVGQAVEESLRRAIARKIGGQFSRAFDSDVLVTAYGKRAALIVRRQNQRGVVDVLECTSDLDRRVAVALALLILGSEP
jgi:hypothetical protein